MTNLDESYDTLKTLAINKCASRNVNITSLKQLFTEKINSPRMFCQITDLNSLIKVLEKRGVLSPVKIEAFEQIFKALEAGLKPELLNDHHNLINKEQKCVFMNKYENEAEVGFPELNISGQRLASTTLPTSQDILPERVIHFISNKIGHSWKVLARYLNVVEEATINKIEDDDRIKDNELRTRLMLENYCKNMADIGSTRLETRTRLLKALRLSKNLDIYETVEKLFLSES